MHRHALPAVLLTLSLAAGAPAFVAQDARSTTTTPADAALAEIERRFSIAPRDENEDENEDASRERAPRRQAALLARRRQAALRALVAEGLLGAPDARRDALALLPSAVRLVGADATLRILEGEGSRPDLLRSDPEVRRRALAEFRRLPGDGPSTLVGLAVEADEPVRLDALASLPEELPPAALARLSAALRSSRELHVNRAAMIAGAHGAAALIPDLIAAQYEPPRERRGDEAWIAIGKSISYIAGAVPVVGDASGAFQPVPGTIFEGSVLRIMESVVEIYRTEVHVALASVVERATGEPAPPFGYDRERWLAWHRESYPALAKAHADRLDLQRAERTVRSEGVGDEG